MFLDPATNFSAPSRQDADELADRIREWSHDQDTASAIAICAATTRDWLKNNKIPDQWLKTDKIFSKLCEPDKGELVEWWTPPTRYDDEVMAEGRAVLLRQRVYDYGLLHFLKQLVAATLINVPRDQDVDELLQPTSFFGFNQLLLFARLKALDPSRYQALLANPEKNISSAAVAELFGIKSANRSQLFRKKLVRFGSLGLVTSRPGMEQGRVIELGPAGEAFFVEVYLPILKQTPLQQD
ncbi:hypothetical protein [Rhizobium hainanense]|uniref:Uncharacterized protein n=1 Tax=Rhizobium hainanense TaxID=52131 RepID=A0A1C3WC72_9HYPH|nr:hypothetical protein [Rhizobium hainanense]SCB37475.1 hypothetical protein GA0061100_11512 [Rhizobium hainanense]